MSPCVFRLVPQDSKISSLERGLREVEEEVNTLKSNGALSSEEREEEMKQMEVYRSHSKFMKNKMEQVKQDLGRRDSELLGLRTKLETLNNQQSDSKQHVDVLKESLSAKEQRAAILQTEKGQQISEMTEERGTQSGEISDLKDMLDVKERKVNVLQKKIENLQDQLRDKEKQLGGLKDRVKSLQTDTSNTDTALGTLEEEKASSLASGALKRDGRLKSLEVTLEQKRDDCLKLEGQLKRAQSSVVESEANQQFSERASCLEQEVTRHKEEAARAQQEVERLLDILREMENEKNDKDKKIHALESYRENKPHPPPPLGQWESWCGTTWAREWLVLSSQSARSDCCTTTDCCLQS
ncbi:hypothetical protein NHX12_020494, partial [Muraenolepis orangiensis]